MWFAAILVFYDSYFIYFRNLCSLLTLCLIHPSSPRSNIYAIDNTYFASSTNANDKMHSNIFHFFSMIAIFRHIFIYIFVIFNFFFVIFILFFSNFIYPLHFISICRCSISWIFEYFAFDSKQWNEQCYSGVTQKFSRGLIFLSQYYYKNFIFL